MPPTIPSDPSQADPAVIALMHGIVGAEGTNGNPTTVGDQGTAAGIAQWSNQVNGVPQKLQQGQVPINFQNDAKQYGLDPTDFSIGNQNKVLYAEIASGKAKGLSPEQILSAHNSGDPNKYLNATTSTGTGPVGAYNVADYVSRGMKAAQEFAQSQKGVQAAPSSTDVSDQTSSPPVTPLTATPSASSGSQPPVTPLTIPSSLSGSGTPTPTPGTDPSGGFLSGLQEDLTNSNPDSYGTQIGNTITGVANTLLPSIGDAYNDVTGKNKKTGLQQLGDLGSTGLTALTAASNLIPGVGEAADAADAARLADAGATAAKSSGLLSKTGGLATGQIAKNAAIGYGAGTAQNLSQGESLGQAVTPNATNLTGAATGGLLTGFGKMLGAAGDKISFSVIKPTAADIKDGFSIDTIKNNNLGGTLNQTLTKTQKLMGDLSSQLKAKLAGSNSSIDLAGVYDKTVKDLTSHEGNLQNFGSTEGVGRVLQRLQNEVLTANPTGSLSIPDAQVVKQAAGGMGAWQFGRTDPDANASETVYNTFYHNLKQEIEDKSPAGVKEINQKMSDLIPVMNAVIRRIPVAERSGAFSLPDMVGMVGSVMNPAALVPLALERGAKSGIVGGLLSKAPGLANKIAPIASELTSKVPNSGLLSNL